MNIANYARICMIFMLLCILMLMSACGASGSSVVTPHVNIGKQIAQPSPSVSPFPVHHSAAPDSVP
jgi:hypothetical protein